MKPRLIAATLFALAFQVVAITPCWAEDITRQSASGGCMLFIKQLLHDPGSAEFGHSQEATVLLKGNRAVVIRSVRATNGFGAKRLEEFMCFIENRNGIITPILFVPKGEKVAQANALYKKWNMP